MTHAEWRAQVAIDGGHPEYNNLCVCGHRRGCHTAASCYGDYVPGHDCACKQFILFYQLAEGCATAHCAPGLYTIKYEDDGVTRYLNIVGLAAVDEHVTVLRSRGARNIVKYACAEFK